MLLNLGRLLDLQLAIFLVLFVRFEHGGVMTDLAGMSENIASRKIEKVVQLSFSIQSRMVIALRWTA